MNGNQVKESDSKSKVTTVNEYDAENRLSRAVITMPSAETLPDPASGLSVETAPEAGSTDQIKTITQENLYNGNGQRIRKSEGAKETHYFYQDGVVSYTMEGRKETKAVQNLLGLEDNVIMAESDGLEYHLYNKDIQGSTTSVLDADGTGELSYEYDDFGETEINGNSAFQNEICYTGGIYDEMTGLYYLNARYYDPESGRFLTEDTYRGELNEPDTLHLYVYCKNNPINYVDPSGHWQLALAGAGYGYIVGSGAMAVGTGTAIAVGGAIFVVTAIVIVGVYYHSKKGIKVRLKESKSKAKSKEKSKAKGKTKSKSKNVNNRATSKKVWQRGKTERVEVENYGNGRGNIHYHEPNNTKWYYSIARKWFEYSNGRKAPSRIQKCLKDPAIKKAIQKALKYLDK